MDQLIRAIQNQRQASQSRTENQESKTVCKNISCRNENLIDIDLTFRKSKSFYKSVNTSLRPKSREDKYFSKNLENSKIHHFLVGSVKMSEEICNRPIDLGSNLGDDREKQEQIQLQEQLKLKQSIILKCQTMNV